ncbi:MAG: hypothetical protein GF329_18635 [Candidatus Lokiarchaeota archaeon]|nr:hypothetical protein [Candidatus Lokiarchaeota archaeon]
MRIIEEIWIINPSGVTIFNLSEGEKVDPQLIGGFFSAINSFIQQLGEKNLKTLILGRSKMTILQGFKKLLFIARSKKDAKNKKILKMLNFVEEEFKKKYNDILDDWDGDTEIFLDFGKNIEEIFNDTPEKRTKEALW